MRAGRRRTPIRIESATTAPDAVGQPVKTWSTFASLVFAHVKALGGDERVTAGAEQAKIRQQVSIDYRAGVLPGMRVVINGGGVSDIVSVNDIDERHHTLVMVVETDVE